MRTFIGENSYVTATTDARKRKNCVQKFKCVALINTIRKQMGVNLTVPELFAAMPRKKYALVTSVCKSGGRSMTKI